MTRTTGIVPASGLNSFMLLKLGPTCSKEVISITKKRFPFASIAVVVMGALKFRRSAISAAREIHDLIKFVKAAKSLINETGTRTTSSTSIGRFALGFRFVLDFAMF